MKRTKINPVRKKRRRGEPTTAEKRCARVLAFARANGMCQLRRPGCLGYAPLNADEDGEHQGQLVHVKGKRRFGWMEGENQEHLWGCWRCHLYVHAKGWNANG